MNATAAKLMGDILVSMMMLKLKRTQHFRVGRCWVSYDHVMETHGRVGWCAVVDLLDGDPLGSSIDTVAAVLDLKGRDAMVLTCSFRSKLQQAIDGDETAFVYKTMEELNQAMEQLS